MDISVLMNPPDLQKEIVLEVMPLAPLSMTSDLPGSYYKTRKIPDKKMVCGLIENLLGWHISINDRKDIIKELKSLRKEQSKNEVGLEFIDETKGSTYLPLLMDYFEVENVQPNFSKVVFYDDLWSKAFRRSDATGSTPTHAKGTVNIDHSLIKLKRDLPRDKKNEKQVDNPALGSFYGENKDKFPFYYSTPTNREYISMEGKYEIKIKIDSALLALLAKEINHNNICYLGNNEGWVDLKIIKI